jgi:hypothetical protein
LDKTNVFVDKDLLEPLNKKPKHAGLVEPVRFLRRRMENVFLPLESTRSVVCATLGISATVLFAASVKIALGLVT